MRQGDGSGGESWGDVRDRVAGFISGLRDVSGRSDGADQVVAIITHAGVMRAVLSVVVDMPLESTWHVHLPFSAMVECGIAYDEQYDRLVSLRG